MSPAPQLSIFTVTISTVNDMVTGHVYMYWQIRNVTERCKAENWWSNGTSRAPLMKTMDIAPTPALVFDFAEFRTRGKRRAVRLRFAGTRFIHDKSLPV